MLFHDQTSVYILCSYHCNFSFISICERITPRLAHANAAVVLSAVKCLMKFMELMVSDSEFVKNLSKKLAPPLVTLLSSEPEVSISSTFIYLFIHISLMFCVFCFHCIRLHSFMKCHVIFTLFILFHN